MIKLSFRFQDRTLSPSPPYSNSFCCLSWESRSLEWDCSHDKGASLIIMVEFYVLEHLAFLPPMSQVSVVFLGSLLEASAALPNVYAWRIILDVLDWLLSSWIRPPVSVYRLFSSLSNKQIHFYSFQWTPCRITVYRKPMQLSQSFWLPPNIQQLYV